MNSEAYLDHLIEKYERDEFQIFMLDDEAAASMETVEILSQLNQIQVPHSFADNLELVIRDRIHCMATQNDRNISLAESHVFGEQKHWDIAPVQSRSPIVPQKLIKRRAWVTFLRIAAVFIIAGVGVLSVSTRSLPGDALYGLNQAEKQFTLTFADAQQSRAIFQIDNLRNALDDLNNVVKEGRDDYSIKLALDTVVAKTSDSQKAVTALPMGSARVQAQQSFTTALAEEVLILRQLLNNVDWPERLAFSQQLGALGDPVPTITHVIIRTQKNGMLLITLTGSNFAPQAQLMFGGKPNGTVNQITSTQLVAFSNNIGWSRGDYAIGVSNPDGTAAQLVVSADDENNPDKQDNHNLHGTPMPNPTHGSDD